MFIKLTSQVEVNDLITAIGANVLDENGNQVHLKPALPALVSLITTDQDTFPEKHHDFVGESACAFAIHCILSKIYADYPTSKLRGMALSFQDLGRLAEAHFQRVKLDKFIEPGHSKEALLYLLGILYDSFDSRMVERYIEQTIKDILLNKYPLEEDAVSTLTKFIISKKGNMDASYAKIADQWKVTLACKLRPNGIVFAVDAIGNSKQKAKSVACQTIVKYFKDHPEELEKFETGQAANDQHQVIQLMTSSTDNNNTDLLEEEIKKEEIKNECIQQTESILGSVKPSSNSKSLDVFRDIFRNDLTKLRESNTSHDIKGAMLNVLNNKPSVTHNTTLTQTGEVHNPIFQVDLVIKSGKHTLRESASARKKKDAEIYAYQKIAKKLLL